MSFEKNIHTITGNRAGGRSERRRASIFSRSRLLVQSRRISRRNHPARHAQRGMTLVEIMVVLVIIGLVMGMVGVAVFGRLTKAQTQVAESQIKKFSEALELYKLSFRSYPGSGEGLEALVSPKGNEEPFMKEIPEDPWGHEYSYMSPGQHNRNSFDICSNGPDEVAGTADDVCNYSTGGSEGG